MPNEYTAVLQATFMQYVRGQITEQEWIMREALVVAELMSQPTNHLVAV